jgi:hypothetical protein
LNSLGFDSTQENIRAAEILSRSGIDITEESLSAINLLDMKIGRLSRELHPQLALKMVKEGMNPLKIHVDEALAFIDNNREEYDGDYGNKIAQLILEMDKSSQMDPTSRESVVGIYRMLSVIKQNGGASLGAAFASGAEHTLGSLFELAKSIKGSRIDLGVDNDSKIKTAVLSDNSIRGIFQRAEQLHASTASETIKEIMNKASSFTDAVKSHPNILKLPLEDLAKLLDGLPDGQGESRALAMLRELAETAPETAAWMRMNGLPVTLGNILGLKSLSKDIFYPWDSLEEDSEILDELDEETALDPANLEQALSRLAKRLVSKRDEARGEELEKAMLALNALRVSRLLHKRELRFPLKRNGKICALNVFMKGSQSDAAFISLKTANLGVVQTEAYFKGEAYDLKVRSESKVISHYLKAKRFGAKPKGVIVRNVQYEADKPVNLLSESIPGIKGKSQRLSVERKVRHHKGATHE